MTTLRLHDIIELSEYGAYMLVQYSVYNLVQSPSIKKALSLKIRSVQNGTYMLALYNIVWSRDRFLLSYWAKQKENSISVSVGIRVSVCSDSVLL